MGAECRFLLTFAACSTAPGVEDPDEELVELKIEVTAQGDVHTLSFLSTMNEGQLYAAQVAKNLRSAAVSLGSELDLKILQGNETQTVQVAATKQVSLETQMIVYMKLAIDVAKIMGIEPSLNKSAKTYINAALSTSKVRQDLSYSCVTPFNGGASECHLSGSAGGVQVDMIVDGVLCDETTPCWRPY